MTITYTLEVSRARFWGFFKLLGRWRGSAYKLMYRELASFLVMYYTIAVLYRYVFDDPWKRRFESFATYCREFLSVVPITFVLGFYLSFVVGRWWQQYLAIPWPDKLAIGISAYVQGADERGRMIRRSLVRYLNLISCLTFQQTSTIIKKRFPTLEHMLEAGIMTGEEKMALETTQTPHGLWWIPAHWFGQLAMLARKEGRIHDDLHLKSLIDDMIEFRNACGTVWSYDWISVVAIAVYSFFASCLFGRQFLYKSPIPNDATNNGVDYYVPIFTIFQFLFYVGWLKVAEAMICPFGSDDDVLRRMFHCEKMKSEVKRGNHTDFELNWIIDRNIQVSYLIVDQLYRNTPKPTKDALWNDIEIDLPYTQASANYRKDPFFGSTNAMSVSEKLAEWNLPEQMTPIDEEAAIGLRETLNSIDSKFRQRKVRNRKSKIDSPTDDAPKEPKDEDSDNAISESQTADLSDEEEDEVEADQRSNGSTQYNVTLRLKGRLAGLPLGTSRQTLGSKNSLNSRMSRKRSSTSKFSMQRSPQSSISRPKSIPGSKQKINMRPRRSSPTIRNHRDGIPDDLTLQEQNYIRSPLNNQEHVPSISTLITEEVEPLPYEATKQKSEDGAELKGPTFSAPGRISQVLVDTRNIRQSNDDQVEPQSSNNLTDGNSTSRTPLISVEEEEKR